MKRNKSNWNRLYPDYITGPEIQKLLGDFGQGNHATDNVVNSALIIYYMGSALGFTGESIPQTNGGIELTLSLEGSDHFLTISINPELLNLSYEIGVGSNYTVVSKKKNVSFEDIQRYLLEIKNSDTLKSY